SLAPRPRVPDRLRPGSPPRARRRARDPLHRDAHSGGHAARLPCRRRRALDSAAPRRRAGAGPGNRRPGTARPHRPAGARRGGSRADTDPMARARVTDRLGRRVAELERMTLRPDTKRDLVDAAVARAMIRFARSIGHDDWVDAALARARARRMDGRPIRPDPPLDALARSIAKAPADPAAKPAR